MELRQLFFSLPLLLLSCELGKKVEHPNYHYSNDLFPIEGLYELEEKAEDCALTLTLFKKASQLMYQLKVENETYIDSAEIQLNEEKNGYYLTLKNLSWSEYKGELELDENQDYIENELDLPTTIQGVLFKDELIIQNVGNAMNYYVKIAACDLKYIHLKRK